MKAESQCIMEQSNEQLSGKPPPRLGWSKLVLSGMVMALIALSAVAAAALVLPVRISQNPIIEVKASQD